jgi:hypothetical protein
MRMLIPQHVRLVSTRKESIVSMGRVETRVIPVATCLLMRTTRIVMSILDLPHSCYKRRTIRKNVVGGIHAGVIWRKPTKWVDS